MYIKHICYVLCIYILCIMHYGMYVLYTCVIYMRYIAAGGAGRVAQDARVPPPQPGALHPFRLHVNNIVVCVYMIYV